MTARMESALIRALARHHGILTAYRDVQGQRVCASVDTLRALLGGLGVPARNSAECAASWRISVHADAERLLDDVVLAWDGMLSEIAIGGGAGDGVAELVIALEDGSRVQVPECLLRAEPRDDRWQGHAEMRTYHLSPAVRLPAGYHRITCKLNGRESTSLLLSAPVRCYGGAEKEGRLWGLFAPLYALRSDSDCGAGSYTELLDLALRTAGMGGALVGTLPLLPCYFEPGREPSPYLPVSRLFWSEFYIDVERLSFPGCSSDVRDLIGVEMAHRCATLRQSVQVDYVGTMRLKMDILRSAYARLSTDAASKSCLDAWLSANPDVARYAAFQVARERLGRSWQEWPEHARRGNLEDVQRSDEEEVRVREFAQRLADAQLMNCVEQAEANGAGLYLDLPIGIHQEGYDTWRYQGEFVEGVAAGAPPDTVFTSGQTWGSPPLHPAAIRARHYDYVRAYLAHHMRAARMLRIDHVMGLHRIFCIPEGAPPAMGAYLRYRPEEWYAILSIESHRHKTVLVGEDLGLVPAQVRRSMTRHRLNRMYVLHYELDGIAAGRSPSLPTRSLASLNTHDMPSFAAMWRGLDICQHARVGIVRPEQVPVLKASRSRAIQILVHVLRSVCPELDERQDLDVVLRCTLRWLGSRGPKYVVVSVEDLWHETIQQNIPGVGDAYPSWRHRATMTLKEAWRVPEVQAALTELKVVMGAGGPGARREQK